MACSNSLRTVPNLLSLTASFVVSYYEDYIKLLHEDQAVIIKVNAAIFESWNQLKREAGRGSHLARLMSRIETSCILIESRATTSIFSIDECIKIVNSISEEKKCIILANNVDQLFRNLAACSDVKDYYPNTIPCNFSAYDQIERLKSAEDEALKHMWVSELVPENQDFPSLNTAKEIRDWMNAPENTAILSDFIGIDLCHLKLKTIPPEISRITHLQWLALNDNEIYHIPNSFGGLSELKDLSFCANGIRRIPDPFTALFKLTTLRLFDNCLTCLPASFANLTELQELDLSNNQFQSALEPLSNLPKLRELSIVRNMLTAIPASLDGLTALKTLYMGSNKITEVRATFAACTQLSLISLFDNKLTAIPASFADLPALREIYLDNNLITAIPDWLIERANGDPKFVLELRENPLCCIFANESSLRTRDVLLRDSACKTYTCLTSFSALCQLIICSRGDAEIQGGFEELRDEDKILIYKKIYEESGSPSDADPATWGKDNVFADMDAFKRSVRNAVSAKFSSLSPEEKNKVYDNIHRIANPITLDPRWGERHAFENVLRLIDAMDTAMKIDDDGAK